jgi:outer membrane protein OmpA-like peptidoglycan-associated protein
MSGLRYELRGWRTGVLLWMAVAAGCATVEPPITGSSNSTIKSTGSATAPTTDRGHPVGVVNAPSVNSVINLGGSYQDRLQAEIQQQIEGTNVRIVRAGESVKIIVPGNIAFALNSEQIQPNFVTVLNNVAEIIRKYEKTSVDIRGYTDSTGSFEHNQDLSERRAQSIANLLISKQVVASRIRTAGYGPRYPLAPNTNESGRAQNRRVEIDLQPR